MSRKLTIKSVSDDGQDVLAELGNEIIGCRLGSWERAKPHEAKELLGRQFDESQIASWETDKKEVLNYSSFRSFIRWVLGRK